jgi:hypothetical protein
MVERLGTLRGEALLASMQDVIQTARANDDGDTAAEFARHLIEASSAEGRLDYEMIGFGQLKDLYQRDARYADLRREILWYYKWITEHLPEYVAVPAAQVESTFQDMERFYRAENEGLRPVLGLRARAAAFMGRDVEAEHYATQWAQAAEQETDDCPACQTHSRVQLLLDLGRPEEAVEAAGPVLQGEQSCEEVPATTFSRLLLPLLLLDRAAEALFLSTIIRRQVRLVPGLVGYLADHIVFLSAAGVLDVAKRLAVVMAARAEGLPSPWDQFTTSRAMWVFLSRFVKEGGGRIVLPRTQLSADGEAVPAEKAAAYYEGRARRLAKQFDARNGTDRFSNLIAQAEQLAAL